MMMGVNLSVNLGMGDNSEQRSLFSCDQSERETWKLHIYYKNESKKNDFVADKSKDDVILVFGLVLAANITSRLKCGYSEACLSRIRD